MAALRTQIYLTQEQRRRLDTLASVDGRPLAGLIREAVDEYLDRAALDPDVALAETFGAVPTLAVPPRGEWAGRAGGGSPDG